MKWIPKSITACQSAPGSAAWGNYSGSPWVGPISGATPGSSSTCYDNSNNAAIPFTYSLTQNNGAGVNCALPFKLQ